MEVLGEEQGISNHQTPPLRSWGFIIVFSQAKLMSHERFSEKSLAPVIITRHGDV